MEVVKENKRDESWYVDQYNRNRLPEDWIKSYKEIVRLIELKRLMESLNKRDGSK